MMVLYFKQAWQLLKQNPLFSSVYILGTGSIETILQRILQIEQAAYQRPQCGQHPTFV
jgi:hypothetical protein